MSKTWLLLDMGYLCYRAFFTTGGLSFQASPTGVVFGVLRDLLTLSDRFGTHRMVFCFDHGKGLREKEYKGYKKSRRDKVLSDEEQTAIDGMRKQVDLLKREYLTELGYPNILYKDGYEADDLIAGVVEQHTQPDNFVIVSADHDLYQILSKSVSIYNPRTKELTTEESFRAQWNISPKQWVRVKAIAGCKTDDVPGVVGVGEKTAARYVAGVIEEGKIYERIRSWVRGEEYDRNIHLVRLPYPMLGGIKIEEHDPPDQKAWARLTERLGMDSLRDGAAGPRQWGGFGLSFRGKKHGGV